MIPNFTLGMAWAIAICLASTAQIVFIFYKARRIELLKREAIVRKALEQGVYESVKPGDDGYVFTRLWKASDIYRQAELLGYTLDLKDLSQIVQAIRREFDPMRGVNTPLISVHITKYVRAMVKERHNGTLSTVD